MKEYRDLTADPLQDSITAGPVSEDNMLEWEALVQGPEGTPYVSSFCPKQRLNIQEGGVFPAKLLFVSFINTTRADSKPADYPLNPFTMTFDPPLLHPNSESTCLIRLMNSLFERRRLYFYPSSSRR